MPLGFKKPEHQGYIGRRLSEIAEQRGQDWADCAIDLLVAENQRIATVFFSMSEDNLRLQLRETWVKISTDAPGLDPKTQTTPVHPRAYGTYPRVLGHYSRDLGILTMEDAVRKMSGAVADRLSLPKRGYLFPEFYADVVVFDGEGIIDNATFAKPHELSAGIEQVWVNGVRVLQNGTHTGAKPGCTVRPRA
jgi:N-acyl-D-aspartate/D-glutamate deacylase